MKISALIVILLFSLSENVFSWEKAVHSGIIKAVAKQAGIVDEKVLEQLAIEANWADTRESEDGEGAFGIDEELNLWYDNKRWISGTNPDHWLSIYSYDRWWLRPNGAADVNAEKFLNNAGEHFKNDQDKQGFQLLGRGAHFIQDMGTPYHALLWINFDTFHLRYEKWADEQWDNLEFEQWAQSGASHSKYYAGKTIKEITVDLARISRTYKKTIKFGRYKNNPEVTQYLIWYTARALGAASAIAAPEHFRFQQSAETIENKLNKYCPKNENCFS